MNDYVGKLLHEARYRDLLKEAEGARRIKAARAGGMTPLPDADSPRPLATLGGTIVVSLFLVLVVSAALAVLLGVR